MRKLFFFLCLIFSFKNYAQSFLKKDSIVINNYIKAQNLQKKNPEILVIEDKKWVDLIRNYTNSKQKSIEDKFLTDLKTKSIGERFNFDDKTVETEIISIINHANNDSIKKLFLNIIDYSELSYGNNQLEKEKIISPELKSLLFECLKNSKLERQTASVLSENRIEGFQEAIKERLLSGQSSDEIGLFCSLKYCDIGDVVDYFFNSLLKNEKYTSKEIFKNPSFASNLTESYFYNTKIDSTTRKKIIKYSLELLKKFPIDSTSLKNHTLYVESNWMPGSPIDYFDQFNFITFLLSTDNEMIIPLIENLKTLGVKDNLTFKFLNWKLGVDQSKENFNTLLNSCEFYNFTTKELLLKGLLTIDDEDYFVNILSKIEKPSPEFNFKYEYKDCLHPDVFNFLERKDFNRILNKSIKSDYNKKEITKKYNDLRNRNIVYRLMGKNNLRKGLPNSWIAPTLFECYDIDALALPQSILKLCDSLKVELETKNYEVFHDADFHNYFSDEPDCTQDNLNTLRVKSFDELKDMIFFIDHKYIREQDISESNKYEFNCFVFLKDIVCFVKINDKVDDRKIIFNDLSDILLKKVGSLNRFIEINPLKQKILGYYTFGNPEIVNGILNKYDFKN